MSQKFDINDKKTVRKAISYEKRLEIVSLKKHTTLSNGQIAAIKFSIIRPNVEVLNF